MRKLGLQSARRSRRRGTFEFLQSRNMLYGEPFDLMTLGLSEYFEIDSSGLVYAASSADFNKVGIDDIIYGTGLLRSELAEENAQVGVALGDGAGGFEVASVQAVNDDVISFQVADLNDDGWEDVVIGGIWRLSVALAKTNADGSWAGLGQPIALGGPSSSLMLEDFDGDGRLDIGALLQAYTFSTRSDQWPYVVTNEFEPGFSIYRGLDEGQFELSVQMPAIRAMTRIDFDGDGDTDILERLNARTGVSSSEILLYRNSSSPGEIRFEEAELTDLNRLPTSNSRLTYTINGDAWPDAIEMDQVYDFGSFYSRNETMIRLGQEDGSLGGPVHLLPQHYQKRIDSIGWPIQIPWPMFLDTDGNGKNDFVMVENQRIHVIRQGFLEGFATTAINYPASRDDIYYGKLRDINSDGLIDFVGTAGVIDIQSERIDKCLVQLGLPGGEFEPDQPCVDLPADQRQLAEKYLFRYIATSWDFDNDGEQDQIPNADNGLFLIDCKDVDHDGNLDLVYSNDPESWNGNRTFATRLGQGTGQFAELKSLDRDRLPVAVHGSGGVGVAVYRQEKNTAGEITSSLETRFQLPLPNANDLLAWEGYSVHEIALQDIDGDGDEDLIVPHGSGVAVVLATGWGDYDLDGYPDADDHAAIRRAWQLGATIRDTPEMDLNEDGRINRDDELAWIHNVAQTVEGDLNLDRRVDFADFLILSSHYGNQDADLAVGDIDGDGQVTRTDYQALLANFGKRELAAPRF